MDKYENRQEFVEATDKKPEAKSHGIHYKENAPLANISLVNQISWQYGYGGDGNFPKYRISNLGIICRLEDRRQ